MVTPSAEQYTCYDNNNFELISFLVIQVKARITTTSEGEYKNK